ncbi:MAG TPA: DUF6265 family protein, partial [Polyangiaceae bacterium]|nr:DUF6265 family protein [Polyangiaceae bacterium]
RHALERLERAATRGRGVGLALASSLSLSLCCAGCVPTSACAPGPGAPPSIAAAATNARASAPVEIETARRDIAHVLDDWHDAAAHADEARYFDHLADDAVFLGTDATERWDKAAFLAYAHPHFAKGKAWTFRATRRSTEVDAAAGLAWFDEELDTAGLGPARGSGVLRLEAGKWRIVQYNLAITVPNARFDATKLAATTATLLRASDASLSSLAWLAGSWVTTTDGGATVEEHWTTPVGGVMVGVGRESNAGATTFFELLRIEERKTGIVLVAQPRGGKATDFALSAKSTPDEAIFENSQHDFPQRIAYARGADEVRVTVSGRGQPDEVVSLRRALFVPK